MVLSFKQGPPKWFLNKDSLGFLHTFILLGNLCELLSSPFAFLPLSVLSLTSRAIFFKVPSKCHNHQTTTANNGNALVSLPKALIYQCWIIWPALILGCIFHSSGRGKRTVLRFCSLFSWFSFDARQLYKRELEKPYSPNQTPLRRGVPHNTKWGTFPLWVLLHMLHCVPLIIRKLLKSPQRPLKQIIHNNKGLGYSKGVHVLIFEHRASAGRHSLWYRISGRNPTLTSVLEKQEPWELFFCWFFSNVSKDTCCKGPH